MYLLDTRVVSASNRDLTEETEAGRFREDLFYRLNVVHVELPALAERGDDLVLLARYLLQRYAEEYGAKVKGAGETPEESAPERPKSERGSKRGRKKK